jgi:hypothetical protein
MNKLLIHKLLIKKNIPINNINSINQQNINKQNINKQNNNTNNYNNSLIISQLNNEHGYGFYSRYFFLLNHYIYCKKNKINFKIDDSNWLFKYKYGYIDYFEDIKLNFYDDTQIKDTKIYKQGNIIGNYSIDEYKNIISEIYRYNQKTLDKINEIKNKFNLIDDNYDSIFIRRGDKLYAESEYIESIKYLEYLLKLNPNCQKIFLQTDDYNTYIDLQNYIKENNLNIEIITLCDPNDKGIIVFNNMISNLDKKISSNNNNTSNYVKTIINDLKKQKPVNQMNSEEIYEHTITMIIGIDIVCKSHFCVTDYQSNVSRFIKLFHNNYNLVYDIIISTNQINLQKQICPSYSF